MDFNKSKATYKNINNITENFTPEAWLGYKVTPYIGRSLPLNIKGKTPTSKKTRLAKYIFDRRAWTVWANWKISTQVILISISSFPMRLTPTLSENKIQYLHIFREKSRSNVKCVQIFDLSEHIQR